MDTTIKAAFLSWNIWKQRNSWSFKHQPPDPGKAIQAASHQSDEFLNFWRHKLYTTSLQRSSNNHLLKWRPPPTGILKINVDASFVLSTKSTALALICRNSEGQMIDGAVFKGSAFSPLAAEADSLKFAMLYALKKGWKKCLFESDCSILVDCCNSTVVDPPWEIAGYISMIRELKSNFYFFVLGWVGRECNKIAVWLALSRAVWLFSSVLEYNQAVQAKPNVV